MAATESGVELAVAGEGLIVVEGEELIAIMQVGLQFFTLLAVVVGALIAYKGLKSSHDWNRRQLAITECLRARKQIKAAQEIFREKKFDYVERDKNNAYSCEEIHKVLRYGSLEANDDRDVNGSQSASNKFVMCPDGEIIKHAILDLLSAYEYLSAGVNQTIFDEQAVREVTGGGLINAYNLFKTYILHLRDKHYKRDTLFSNLEKLAKKWENENLSYEKRKQTDH